MNKNGNQYAIAALKDKRASLASEVSQTARKLSYLKDALLHVDAALKIFDPAIEVDAIPPKRFVPGRVKLFRQGQLGQMVLDALRAAKGEPVSTAYVVDHLIAAGGYDAGAKRAIVERARGSLAHLVKREAVIKIGDHGDAMWRLS